ncbi:MAG: site-2 protease family protein [Clostridia bacterium]|nr:site-2 protease family protein [Clostridia bacterium]
MLICATFTEVMTTIGYVLLALCCLMFMVVVHEFGHYIAGKFLKFKINEFAIGFGPRILKFTNKKNGEVFSIRPFPLGGFCQFEGEDEDSENAGAFNNQAPWKRLIVLFSGAFFNFLSAIILITLVFTFYGQILPVVGTVYEESALYQDGTLQSGDVIISVNGKQVNIVMQDDMNKAFAKVGDDGGTFTVLRNGKKITIDVARSAIFERDAEGNIVYDENGIAKTNQAFGFTVGLAYTKLDFFTALGRSFSYSFFMVYKILWSFGQLFTGAISFTEGAGGPVTIITTMSDAAKSGFGVLCYVVCLISANLAVMNLLPLPALDGARMVFTVIEWIFKKPVNRKVEGIIHFVGMIILFGIAILADVFQFLV